MKFALVKGVRREAEKGLNGNCICCNEILIAKCGEKKIHHWAHKSKKNCDIWWENESDWHRNWKNHFPNEWQEVVHKSNTGEIHIADVKTENNWVIEFQYSPILTCELYARTNFYQKIAWVVSGTRRIRDKTQFFKELEKHSITSVSQIFILSSRIVKEWSGLPVPVFFDFGEDLLWLYLPIKDEMWAYFNAIPRTEFVELMNENDQKINSKFERYIGQLVSSVFNYELNKRAKNFTDSFYQNNHRFPLKRKFRF